MASEPTGQAKCARGQHVSTVPYMVSRCAILPRFVSSFQQQSLRRSSARNPILAVPFLSPLLPRRRARGERERELVVLLELKEGTALVEPRRCEARAWDEHCLRANGLEVQTTSCTRHVKDMLRSPATHMAFFSKCTLMSYVSAWVHRKGKGKGQSSSITDKNDTVLLVFKHRPHRDSESGRPALGSSSFPTADHNKAPCVRVRACCGRDPDLEF